MKSIFENQSYAEIVSRLNSLSEKNQAQWGKMNVTQMMVHCQKVIEVALGEKTLKKPNPFMGLILKLMKPSLYNNKKWKENIPTAKEYVITDTATFETEKNRLKKLIEKIHGTENYFKPSKVHPYFGNMNSKQWGQSAYKHLDHHFRQFGV